MPQFDFLRRQLLAVVAVLLAIGSGYAMAADASSGGGSSQAVSSGAGGFFSHIRPMNDGEVTSASCAGGATAGMAAAYAAGPSEVIMLIVGGMVVPSNSSVLFLGLFGTIAAAGCTIGSSLQPAVAWLYRHIVGAG